MSQTSTAEHVDRLFKALQANPELEFEIWEEMQKINYCEPWALGTNMSLKTREDGKLLARIDIQTQGKITDPASNYASTYTWCVYDDAAELQMTRSLAEAIEGVTKGVGQFTLLVPPIEKIAGAWNRTPDMSYVRYDMEEVIAAKISWSGEAWEVQVTDKDPVYVVELSAAFAAAETELRAQDYLVPWPYSE